MSRSRSLRVLAIGIDAAEPTLIRRLIDRGEMPSMSSLLKGGAWGRIQSPAHIGSGTVWPTFMTGTDPSVHGIYSSWPWNVATMGIVRLTTDHLTPFWVPLAHRGYRVGVVDVPFAPVAGLEGGAEISEWGAHDKIRGYMAVSPHTLQDWVTRNGGVHPLSTDEVDASGPHDTRGLERIARLCREGATLRGALAARLLSEKELNLLIVVFSEVHRASHFLWHTVDPTHPAHPREGVRPHPTATSSLIDICRQVDHVIGRLVEIAGSDATVLVFSLHGMRSAQGTPTILDPLLRTLGLASTMEWRRQTWSERARRSLGGLKRGIPPGVRRLLRQRVPQPLAQLTRPGRLPPYDWSRTSAFPVPTDQHGWIRLNLAGREVRGMVDPDNYAAVCTRLEKALRGLTTRDGSPVVSNVLCLGRDSGTPPQNLPDIIVHWDAAASADPLHVKEPRMSVRPSGTRFTGQHAHDGFFILRPAADRLVTPDNTVSAANLHRLIEGILGAT